MAGWCEPNAYIKSCAVGSGQPLLRQHSEVRDRHRGTVDAPAEASAVGARCKALLGYFTCVPVANSRVIGSLHYGISLASAVGMFLGFVIPSLPAGHASASLILSSVLGWHHNNQAW
jgi:hypothetical protein